MYHSKLVSVLLIISFVLNLCTGTTIYPKSLQTQKGSSSTVPISALQTQDQSGSQDTWNKYVEFYGMHFLPLSISHLVHSILIIIHPLHFPTLFPLHSHSTTGSSTAYSGIFTFDASNIDASSVSAHTLTVNYKGPSHSTQVWQFEYFEAATNSWILAGDNSAATSWKWTYVSFFSSSFPLIQLF